jgi:hypothetical protein
MKWFEMSYYQYEKEENESMADRLRKESLACRSCQEWEDLTYRRFEEDNYDDESEA